MYIHYTLCIYQARVPQSRGDSRENVMGWSSVILKKTSYISGHSHW